MLPLIGCMHSCLFCFWHHYLKIRLQTNFVMQRMLHSIVSIPIVKSNSANMYVLCNWTFYYGSKVNNVMSCIIFCCEIAIACMISFTQNIQATIFDIMFDIKTTPSWAIFEMLFKLKNPWGRPLSTLNVTLLSKSTNRLEKVTTSSWKR